VTAIATTPSTAPVACSASCDHQSPRDAHHRQLDAEELQQPGPERHGSQQQGEAVYGRFARQHRPLRSGQASGQTEKERSGLERIDDGKQAGERQQERAGDTVHCAGALSS
jgi:hypothetical protein